MNFLNKIRKLLAKIIGTFIPSKLIRAKVRAVIMFGPINWLIASYRAKREEPKLKFKNYLSICAIIKNEGDYLKEWIEFHRLVGVEKFYIYDNESTDNTKEILASYIKEGIVEYVLWPGLKQQIPAYNDAIKRYKYDTRWLGFIDLDEFIVPIETKIIPEFLVQFEPYSGLEINWLTYGSNGHETQSNCLVIERFKAHAAPDFVQHRWMKSIVNPRFVANMGPHYADYLAGHAVNPNKSKVHRNNFNDRNPLYKLLFRWRFLKKAVIKPLHDKIRINHYSCKSWEEFSKKSGRGDVMQNSGGKYSRKFFNMHDRNDIIDRTMDKYIKPVKKAMTNKS